MKQFTLTLIINEPRTIDKIEADDLLELLSQFLLVIARANKLIESHIERHTVDDDIPF